VNITTNDDAPPEAELLRTTVGDFALHEYRFRAGERAWSVLHTEAILSHDDEQRFLGERRDRVPYGVALWPASIALAHDLAARGDTLRGTRVLELGAGTGLPGIVAAAHGAHVVQTDRHEVAMHVCRRNAARNGVAGLEHRIADWGAWTDEARYDWIVGADVLYGVTTHPDLRRILERNLAPGGRALLESLEHDGWRIALAKWRVGDEPPRAIGVFELAPPA
jgi:predicted nicotinamide N-methyase